MACFFAMPREGPVIFKFYGRMFHILWWIFKWSYFKVFVLITILYIFNSLIVMDNQYHTKYYISEKEKRKIVLVKYKTQKLVNLKSTIGFWIKRGRGRGMVFGQVVCFRQDYSFQWHLSVSSPYWTVFNAIV